MKTIFFSTITAAVLTGSLVAQGWTQLSPATAPTARIFPGMAYSWANNSILLFGGNDLTNALNDTWLWNGTNWSALTPATVPTDRDSQAMTYDVARDRTVMFGGWDTVGNHLNDTWEWSGTDWVNVTPAVSPAARVNPAMVYDLTRGVCVLFGGYDWNTGVSYDDTWEWNGTTWTQITTPTIPTARDSHGMAFDLSRNRTVMFGGWDVNGTPLGDTWEYNGTDWTMITTATSPLPRYYTSMVYDVATNRVVLHSGYDGAVTFGDTFEYDGVNWVQVAGPQPTVARDSMAMAYDVTNNQTVLFGGWDVAGVALGETWGYGAAAGATYSVFGAGCAGSAGVPSLVAQNVPTMGTNFSLDCVNLPAGGGLAYMALGFSNTVWNGVPLPASLQPFGFGSCQGYISPDDGALIVNNAGVANWSIAIPNSPALAGFVFFNQCVSFDAGAGNPAGAAVSDAGQGTIN